MSKTKNATCAGCNKFKPRCKAVRVRKPYKDATHLSDPVSLCEDCRKGNFRGRYKLVESHE